MTFTQRRINVSETTFYKRHMPAERECVWERWVGLGGGGFGACMDAKADLVHINYVPRAVQIMVTLYEGMTLHKRYVHAGLETVACLEGRTRSTFFSEFVLHFSSSCCIS